MLGVEIPARPCLRVPALGAPWRPARRPFVHPRPVKHLRYAAGVTLCISALTKTPEAGPVFVNCTDGRLSGGEWGADDAATKIHAMPYNWMAMMAGSWLAARGLCEHIEDSLFVQPEAPSTKLGIAHIVTASASEFAASSLCGPKDYCELILTGFVKTMSGSSAPVMIYVVLYKSKATVQVVRDVFAIGDAAKAGMFMLRQRKHDPIHSTFEETCYMVYEAKRFGEVMESVGPLTRMFIHAYDKNSEKEKLSCCFQHVSEEGVAKLESLRERFYLKPVTGVEKFPPSYFK